MTAPRTLDVDVDDAVCFFHSNDCTQAVIGKGGVDVHHSWPKMLGGPGTSAETFACPNHHRRQHSLIRYLVQCDQTHTVPAWAVRRRFNQQERITAAYAVRRWVEAGRPRIVGWNVPAARDA